MIRPIAAVFRLLQFCSKNIIYMPMLRGDAEISSSLRVTISLFSGKSNGQRLVGCTFMGRYWGGCLGAVIIGCVGIQLGWVCVVSGLVCLTYFT